MLRSLSRDVALVVITGANDRGIQSLELFEHAVLMGQDGNPGFSPLLGGFNDLPNVSRLTVISL
jgi:hypothetical protein